MVFSWRATPGARRLLLSLLLAAWEAGSGQLHYSVPEEAKHGTFVGRIAQDLGLELAELVPRLFRVASKDRGDLLEVNLQNGILFVNSRIDREELCGRSAACGIHLEVIMEQPLQVFHVEVEVKDINDNPPVFREREQKVRISESAPLDSHFPLEGAADADTGINALLTYRLSLNEYFELKIITKTDKSILPELVLRKSLDREESPEFNLLLTATDGGKPELTGSIKIVITVLDVNDNAPLFDKPVYKVALFENVQNATRFIQLNASDLDDGLNREFFYGIRMILPLSEKCMFLINPDTGDIRIFGILDFEENNAYEIQVNAIDKGFPSMVGHSTVLVEVVDMNDNVPEVIVTSLSLPVQEDAQAGTVIALIRVSDRDSGANGQVTCSLTPTAPFKLVSTFKNYYSLVLRKSLDREEMQEHSLLLTASDGGKPELTSTVQLLITVLDVNDNAPEFDQSIYKVRVPENASNGTLMIKLNATDPDDGTNGDVVYSFRRPVSPAVLYAFIINPNNGEIRIKGGLDFEENKSYEILVEAIDNGNVPMAGHCTVLVEVLDVNDNAPEITITSLSLHVKEDAQPSTVIALISVSDRDSGANGQRLCAARAACVLTYELVLSDPLEFHQMLVRVLDTNDNAPRFAAGDVQLHIPEFLTPGARFPLPDAQDADEGSNGLLSYSLSPSPHFHLALGARADGSPSPKLVLERALDREQRATHRLVLTARDGGLPGRSGEARVTIIVVDTNDNAPVFERSVYRTKIPETAPNGKAPMGKSATP
ncbi:protocadherin alpha-12 [Echinops telfairi]|uniref:Protocadherin alpha-12 n=1 Tax=Echinops telfairi TaxID=9371 RepID=A0AC55CL03_ECHTE|nr:protocadherin alpha-12 [Echinops telfairi]